MNDQEEKPPVFLHDSSDPDMEQAIKRARQTFRYFWRELAWEKKRIIPGLEIAAVKVAFSDPPDQAVADEEAPQVEQMWVNDVDFDGKHVTGTLINQPNWLTSVNEGDAVTIPTSKVNDWMYAMYGTVYGAFTVNVLRARMSSAELSQHDQAWGLDFGDPKLFRVVPPDYLGEAKPGFFARLLGGGKQKPQDIAAVAAREHPMAMNMRESLEELMQDDPANAAVADDRGFTLLHDLAMAGSDAGVKILLKHGADTNAVTKLGMTPLQLAKTLGWKKVVQTLGG